MHAVASRAGAEAKEPAQAKVEDIEHSEGGAVIRGIRLGPDDTLQKGDMFNAGSGKWETCDRMASHNNKIGHKCTAVWVRPVRTKASKAE